MATYIRRKVSRKLLELLQFLADLHLLFPVEQERDYGLCTARILYGLRREEQVVRRFMVVGAVFGRVASCLSGGIFEEEDDAVDCA
jgi:hypothetical protein